MNQRTMTRATKDLLMQAERPIRCPKGGQTMLRKIGCPVTPENERQLVRILTNLKRQGISRPYYEGAGFPSSDRLIMVQPLS